MQSRWVDRDAKAAVDRYAAAGVSPELALRVYTTRLLGGDPTLVLHGGGNTSVKLRMPDLLGDEADVLCVKGSGWDMATIEPPGLPAVRLAALHQLLARDEVSDEDMVRVQRANLIDPMAPNPSVETLLHAFLPHKFVDHTHATAVLSLVDQDNSAELCREVYGERMGFVPYVMPGFGLAKVAAEVFERDPQGRRPDPRQARHLHVRRDRARGLRAHDRDGHARGSNGCRKTARRCSSPRNCRNASLPPPRSRRSCAAPCSLHGRQDRRRVAAAHPRFPHQRRDPQLRQRQGCRALQPGRRHHAGQHHPHQELAADAAARRTAASIDDFARAARDGRDGIRRTTTRPISRARTPASAATEPCSIRCRASCWCRGSDCSGSAAPRRTRRSPPISPKPSSSASPTPRRSAASSRSPRTTCSMSNTGRWSRPSSARPSRCRSPARSPSSPAPAARSAPRPRRPSRRPAPRSRCSTSTSRPSRRRPNRSAARRSRVRCDVTDSADVRAAFDKVSEHFGGVDIVGVERRRGLAGPHRRSRRGDACARASS